MPAPPRALELSPPLRPPAPSGDTPQPTRRRAAIWLATTLLSACGGGGAGGYSGAAGVSATAGAALSPNIAAWGDSLTPGFAENLAVALPGRSVYDGGVASETSSEIAARVLADRSGHNAWINIFWMGTNNPDQPAQIKADLAACIAALAPGNDRFLVLPVFNDAISSEYRGTAMYAAIMQLDAELAAAYPQHYLDVRTFLVSQFDPLNPQDVADVQNDLVPSSLRVDDIHLSYKGQEVAVQAVRNFINARGW
jgi:lysophospholipase L1-like esterase